MAERIVLKEPGTELVMTVSSVKPEIVERNEYYLFTNGSKELLVPQSSIKGRFERLNITAVEQMIGKSVRFARSTKMSRAGAPYWDIDWSGAEQAPVPPAGGEGNAGKPASAPPVEQSAKPKMRDAYKSLTEWVLKEIAPVYEEYFGGEAFTPEVAAACTQTLFIQACYAGKVE